MIPVPARCPQCSSLGCGVIACRFTGIKNADYIASIQPLPAEAYCDVEAERRQRAGMLAASACTELGT